MKRLQLHLDRAARTLAGGALTALAGLALIPALVPALRTAPSEVAEFCRAALVAAAVPLAPVRPHLALLPMGLAGLGLLFAAVDRARQQRRLRRFLAAHRTRQLEPQDPLHTAARNAGIEDRVRIVEGLAAMPAFTTNFMRPRIYISEALFRLLDAGELQAAFRHEAAHLRRRDPLRLAVIRFTERALFWIPLARGLANAAAEAIELRADDAARRGGELELAGAIVKTARLARGSAPVAAPALGHMSSARRARRLLGQPLPRPRIPTMRLGATALVLSLVWASALLAGGGDPHGHTAPCNVCVVRDVAQGFGIGR